MTKERLAPADALFLHLEDDNTHMHVASVTIFDGQAPPYEDFIESIGARLHLVARGVGFQRDGHGRGEHLVVGADGAGQEQRDDGEEGHAHRLVGPPARSAAHPAIRTVVVEPQIARLQKKSSMVTSTIEVRTARPTAMPTPAGPPRAVKP